MAQRIIGLEIGSRKLKAVEVESRFNEFSVLNCWISDLPADFRDRLFSLKTGEESSQPPAAGSPEGQEAQVKQGSSGPEISSDHEPETINQEPGAGDRAWPSLPESVAPEKLLELGMLGVEVSLALPSELCFVREIELPFSDVKKIGQVIRLEAEGYFPFDLEDYLVEFLPPGQAGESSQVLTFALKKDAFSHALNQLKSFNFDPAFFGIEGLTLPLLSLRDGPGARLWLEIGARRTILVGGAGTVPILYRRIGVGLDDLVAQVAQEAGISAERAEKYLQEKDVSEWSSQPGGKTVERWLNSLVAALRETLHWYERMKKGVTLAEAFGSLTLAGGGATIAGLDGFLASALDIPASRFRIPAWILRPEGFSVGEDKEPLLAEPLSLALARLSREGRENLNLRKGEFAYKAQYAIPYRNIAFPAALLVVMIFLGIAKAGTQYSLMKGQSKQIKQEMFNRYSQLLPGSKPADPAGQLKAIYAAGETRLKAERDLLYPSAVECLAAIGDQIPKDLKYVVNKFSYSENKVRLEGETSDFASSKQIVDVLSKVEFFSKVTLEDSRTTPNNKVSFTIQIELKNPYEEKK